MEEKTLTDSSVTIWLNGKPKSVSCENSVTDLVEEIGLDSSKIAVELDKEILPRRLWPSTKLREGSNVEIVHFVGGG
jgi:thiamine biosynthesis protein ThiS